jgi:hypothetical protein
MIIILLFPMEMELELWVEEQGPKDVRQTSLIFTPYSQNLHDDYIYDDKVMRGHTVPKA